MLTRRPTSVPTKPIDTGPLVALLSRHDNYHEICTRQLETLQTPLLTCWPVITEAAWLPRHNAIAIQRLLNSISQDFLHVLDMGDSAGPWLAAFMERYETLGAQIADASLVYLAERENIDTVFTLDRRDFSVYRYKRNQVLTILPDPTTN